VQFKRLSGINLECCTAIQGKSELVQALYYELACLPSRVGQLERDRSGRETCYQTSRAALPWDLTRQTEAA
jgi:hypothetical protein